MSARIIEETDPIAVSCLSLLIYGPPGAWKTSLAQTADNPLTLDFDTGAHRAFNRKRVMRFDTWRDVEDASSEIVKAGTVVLDTVGRLLELISADVIRTVKGGCSATGGLFLLGFGALGNRFKQRMGSLRAHGKDTVMIAHEKEEKKGESFVLRPDIQGQSVKEVTRAADMIGILRVADGGKRWISFDPSPEQWGKNPCNWRPMELPPLNADPTFLSRLLSEAKGKIGATSEEAAEISRGVAVVKNFVERDPPLADLNGWLPTFASMRPAVKKAAWPVLLAFAKKGGLVYDPVAKCYSKKEAS